MKLAIAAVASLLVHVQAVKQPPQAPPAPTSLVLIVCKGHVEQWESQAEKDNAEFTKAENWKWDYPNSKMLCKRLEVPMYDPAEGQGALPLNPNFSDFTQCARVGVTLQQHWDEQNKSTPWRVWRVGCPVPVINKAPDGTQTIIGYKMPDGGHAEQVTFLVDSAI